MTTSAGEIKAQSDWCKTLAVPSELSNVLVYCETPSSAGMTAIRDVTEEDVDRFVEYWHSSGERHLAFLGIDRAKLGTPADTQRRFLRAIHSPGSSQTSVAFSLTLNSNLIGYTNINLYDSYNNYPHLHLNAALIKPATRTSRRTSALNGAGLAVTLVAPILKNYFDQLDIERIVLQTRTRNVLINRALAAYLPVVETRHFEQPDGLAGPGTFHIRHVVRADIPRLVERSTLLRGTRDDKPAD